MGKNDLVDLVRLPASVPPRIAQLEGCQSEGRPSARRLHVDVGRVVFTEEGSKARILLAIHGFAKKSPKTPPRMIELALRRRDEWRSRGA